MIRIPLVYLACLAAAPVKAGEPRFDPETLAKAVAPFRDEHTIAIFHVNLWKIDADQLVGKVVQLTKLGRDQVARDTAFARQNLAAFKEAGGKDLFVVISLADCPHPGVFVVPLYSGSNGDALQRLGHLFQTGPTGQSARLHDALVFGDPRNVARVVKLQTKPLATLAKAFADAGDTTAQVVLLPGAASPELIEHVLAGLPKELGNVPSTIPTREVQWAAAGVDYVPSVRVNVVLQAQDVKAADTLKSLIARLLKQASEMPQVRELVPNIGKLVPALTPKVEGDRLVVTVKEPTLAAALLPVMQKQRAQSGEAVHGNHFKQIAVAMWMFHDTNNSFPPHASYDGSGKPLLSWRVHLLPFLGEDNLYQQFHLNEPWDSAHNRTLITKMPDIYRPPPNSHGIGEGKTLFLAPVGDETIFPVSKGGTQIQDIARGTSNTILVVEVTAPHAVIWTKPEDLNVTPADPQKDLLEPGQRGIRAAFADASFRLLPASTPPDTLWEMFTRGGPRHGDGAVLSGSDRTRLISRPWLVAALAVVLLAVAGWFLARRFRPSEPLRAGSKSHKT
jgi:hypothetical protein